MRRNNGFTLLEIVISLFLLSLVLLGLDAVQLSVQRQSRGLGYFQQASYQAQNMANYLQAHHGVNEGYVDAWRQQLTDVLPHADASVQGSFPTYQIIIQWGVAESACTQNKSGISGCVIRNISLNSMREDTH
jgi:prepilin-type N-terminal cleavage/methylation domain-containing protein